jgi:hypothetical protein
MLSTVVKQETHGEELDAILAMVTPEGQAELSGAPSLRSLERIVAPSHLRPNKMLRSCGAKPCPLYIAARCLGANSIRSLVSDV